MRQRANGQTSPARILGGWGFHVVRAREPHHLPSHSRHKRKIFRARAVASWGSSILSNARQMCLVFPSKDSSHLHLQSRFPRSFSNNSIGRVPPDRRAERMSCSQSQNDFDERTLELLRGRCHIVRSRAIWARMRRRS